MPHQPDLHMHFGSTGWVDLPEGRLGTLSQQTHNPWNHQVWKANFFKQKVAHWCDERTPCTTPWSHHPARATNSNACQQLEASTEQGKDHQPQRKELGRTNGRSETPSLCFWLLLISHLSLAKLGTRFSTTICKIWLKFWNVGLQKRNANPPVEFMSNTFPSWWKPISNAAAFKPRALAPRATLAAPAKKSRTSKLEIVSSGSMKLTKRTKAMNTSGGQVSGNEL